MFGDELGQLVMVLDFANHECLPIAEVQRADVIIDAANHIRPLVLGFVLLGIPADFTHPFIVFT